jgi:hypothetical protein
MPKPPRQTLSGGNFKVTAELDANDLQAGLRALRVASGKEMRTLVKQSGRRVGVDLAIRSFPTKQVQGVGTIVSDVRRVYPSRKRIKETLEKKQEGAGKAFMAILQKSPAKAIRFAESIGVKIELVSRVDNETVRRSVSFGSSKSGSRSTRRVQYDGPLLLLRERNKAIDAYGRRMARRVGTAAGGWVEASKGLGPLRYDGRDARLERFKRARRPMIVGRASLVTTGNLTTATLTNLVEYSDKTMPSDAMAFAVKQEIGNLKLQSIAVLNRKAGQAVARINK